MHEAIMTIIETTVDIPADGLSLLLLFKGVLFDVPPPGKRGEFNTGVSYSVSRYWYMGYSITRSRVSPP